MYCPACGIEYRPGFTHCNDCDVDLVEELPAEDEREQPAAGDELAGPDAPVLLWRGVDHGFYAEMTRALEAAGIAYNRENLDPRLIYSSESTALEIWVPPEDQAAAQKLLEEVIARADQAETAAEIAEYREPDDGDLPEPEPPPEEVHPEDATAEVWSGGDVGVAQFLRSCLLGNGIGCYLDKQDPAKLSLRVRPEDDGRSRGIVKQVVEGIPPE
ncbi:MAG TPA: hypothetical protein VGS20_10230 [Candidatus Acidoferrales bacterium]|nr:hypothetical protein [Candidatus Acidoferrales bacterium]